MFISNNPCYTIPLGNCVSIRHKTQLCDSSNANCKVGVFLMSIIAVFLSIYAKQAYRVILLDDATCKWVKCGGKQVELIVSEALTCYTCLFCRGQLALTMKKGSSLRCYSMKSLNIESIAQCKVHDQIVLAARFD